MFYRNSLRDWIDFLNQTNNLKWETSVIVPKTHKNRKWEITAQQVENGFEVEMIVPGYEKDDIKIEFESSHLLKVSAEENKRGNCFLERVAIPDHCELKEITAEYKNGILTLFFPVKEEQDSGFYIKVK
jgi:HSP20 family molecular chaperone IbpA